MTTVFPVQLNGWQPVEDETIITIGSNSGLKMSEYVIHFDEGSDYYVFFNASNEPLTIQLAGTNLTVTGDVSCLCQIEQDTTNDVLYKFVYVDNRMIQIKYNIDTTQEYIGLNLDRFYIINTNAKIFGRQMLNNDIYNKNNTILISNEYVNGYTDLYNYLLYKSFFITILPEDFNDIVNKLTYDNILFIPSNNLIFSFLDSITTTCYIGSDDGVIVDEEVFIHETNDLTINLNSRAESTAMLYKCVITFKNKQ